MILYLGDTSLQPAAAYLAGVMTHFGLPFEHRPSDAVTTAADLERAYDLYILSDYPNAMLHHDAQSRIVDAVRGGAGLLMIGGWESFHGQGGDWAGTLIANALPVEVATSDDRINCPQPALVRPTGEHAITANLPWHTPPGIGGFNRFTPRPDAQVVLEVDRYVVEYVGREAATSGGGPRSSGSVWPTFTLRDTQPLLVVGAFGAGRTAALATDVAPHWVGGLVDWGAGRVTAKASGSSDIEVGSDYAKLLQQLLMWTTRA